VGDANTAFSFLNDLDLANANVVRDGDDIIAAPVSAVDSGNGGTRLSTIRLQWIKNSQSFGVVDAASGTSFAGVQAIFTGKCTSCHSGSGPALPASMSLEAGKAFQNIIAKSDEDASRLRINPGNSTASYLYQKITGGNISGGRMPLGSAPLSDAEINTIKNWIDEGAPPPQ